MKGKFLKSVTVKLLFSTVMLCMALLLVCACVKPGDETPDGQSAPVISTQSLENGAVGVEYNCTLEASGSDPLIWTLSEGTLPDGITLSETGVLSGIPAVAGSSAFSIRVSNAAGQDERQFTLTVDSTASVSGSLALGKDALGRDYSALYADFDWREVTVCVNTDAGVAQAHPDGEGNYTLVIPERYIDEGYTVIARHPSFYSVKAVVASGNSVPEIVFDAASVKINGSIGSFGPLGATEYDMDEFGYVTYGGADDSHSFLDGVMTDRFIIQARMGFRDGITDAKPEIGFVLNNGSLNDAAQVGIYLTDTSDGIGIMLQEKGEMYYLDAAQYYCPDGFTAGNLFSERTHVTFTVVKELSALYFFIDGVYAGTVTPYDFDGKSLLKTAYGKLTTSGVALSAADNTPDGNKAEFEGILFSDSQTVIDKWIRSYVYAEQPDNGQISVTADGKNYQAAKDVSIGKLIEVTIEPDDGCEVEEILLSVNGGIAVSVFADAIKDPYSNNYVYAFTAERPDENYVFTAALAQGTPAPAEIIWNGSDCIEVGLIAEGMYPAVASCALGFELTGMPFPDFGIECLAGNINGYKFDKAEKSLSFTVAGEYRFRLTAENRNGTDERIFTVNVTDAFADYGWTVVLDEEFGGTVKPSSVSNTPSADVDFSADGFATAKKSTAANAFIEFNHGGDYSGVTLTEVRFRNNGSGFAILAFYLNANGASQQTFGVSDRKLQYNPGGTSPWEIIRYNGDYVQLIDGEFYTLRIINDFDSKVSYLYLCGTVYQTSSGTAQTGLEDGEFIYLGKFNFRNPGTASCKLRIGTDAAEGNITFDSVKMSKSVLAPEIVITENGQTVRAEDGYTLKYSVIGAGKITTRVTCAPATGCTLDGDFAAFTEAGEYVFTIVAENSYGTDTKEVRVTVVLSMSAPVITLDMEPSCTISLLPEGSAGSLPVYGKTLTLGYSAAGADTVALTLTDGNRNGYVYDEAQGTLSFTVAGEYGFKLTASNPAGYDEAEFTVTVTDPYSAENTSAWLSVLDENFDGTEKPSTVTNAPSADVNFSVDGYATANRVNASNAFIEFDSGSYYDGLTLTEVRFKNNSSEFAVLAFYMSGNASQQTFGVSGRKLQYHPGGSGAWTVIKYNGDYLELIDGEFYTLRIINDFDNKVSYLYLAGERYINSSGTEETELADGEFIYLGTFGFRNPATASGKLRIGTDAKGGNITFDYVKMSKAASEENPDAPKITLVTASDTISLLPDAGVSASPVYGKAYTIDYTVDGAETVELILAEGNENGYTYDKATKTLLFTAEGVYRFTLTASNSSGSDEAEFTVTVTNPYSTENISAWLSVLDENFDGTEKPATVSNVPSSDVDFSAEGYATAKKATQSNAYIEFTNDGNYSGLMMTEIRFRNQGSGLAILSFFMTTATNATKQSFAVSAARRLQYHSGKVWTDLLYNGDYMELLTDEFYTVRIVNDYDNKITYLYLSGLRFKNSSGTVETGLADGEFVYLGRFAFRDSSNMAGKLRIGTDAAGGNVIFDYVKISKLVLAPVISVTENDSTVAVGSEYGLKYKVSGAGGISTAVTCENGTEGVDYELNGDKVILKTTGEFTFTVYAENEYGSDTVNITVSAAAASYVTASAEGEGTISPVGDVLVIEGGSVSFSFGPEEHYCIGSIEIDGVALAGDEFEKAAESGSYTFENVTRNRTIKIVFTETLWLELTSKEKATVTDYGYYRLTFETGAVTEETNLISGNGMKEGYDYRCYRDGNAYNISVFTPGEYAFGLSAADMQGNTVKETVKLTYVTTLGSETERLCLNDFDEGTVVDMDKNTMLDENAALEFAGIAETAVMEFVGGNIHFGIVSPSSPNAHVRQYFDVASTNISVFEQRFMLGNNVGAFINLFLLQTGTPGVSGANQISYGIAYDVLQVSENNKWVNVIDKDAPFTFETGRWYTIRYILNYNTQKSSVYVDGNLISTNVFRASTGSTNRVQIGSTSLNADFYLDYIQAYNIKGGTNAPEFPVFGAGQVVLEMDEYEYNPRGEFQFPTVIDAKLHLENPIDRYYLFYAPHDAPGGICLATAPSLDGVWTEYGANPIVPSKWEPNYSVSHVSAQDVVWNDVYNCYFMYFHGENNVTRYATSVDLLNWTYGGICFDASEFNEEADEASYGRVFEHTLPGIGNKYIMLLMINKNQPKENIRRIYYAYSDDGKEWTPVAEPLIDPNPTYAPATSGINYGGTGFGAGNFSGPFFHVIDGRYFVTVHASDGDVHIIEVGESLDMEIHWGVVYDSVADSPDNGRAAGVYYIQDDDGVWYMFYEAGPRQSNANIAFAKQITE